MKKFSSLSLLAIFFFQLNAQCPNYSRPGIHVVQSGENLFRIAKKYNLSLIDLANWNNISTNTILYACQELAVSNTDNNFVRDYTYSDNNLVERSGYNYASAPMYQKQSGGKHMIRQGETIEELARLYGYTEERFRRINLLKPGEQLSPGSIILSTDCTCDRVTTYEDLNARPSSSNSYPNYDSYDRFQDRGYDSEGTYRPEEYDRYYDDPYESSPPPAEPIGGQITSLSNPGSGTYSNNQTTNNDNPAVPTPTSASYMTNEELAMLDEINLVRSNPVGYIKYIEAYKKDIQSGKSFGSSLAVCDELIAELRTTPVLSVLKPLPCLYNAAKMHGLDQKQRGSTGHNGSDGSWPWDRVKRACTQLSDGNENLVGGPSSVREAVILLLVDDGIPSRGHRKTLLNKDWIYGTCYKVGQIGYIPNCWVQKFGH